jgi:16S rRNA (uracil1498-N3)-methyltransferase
MEGEAAHHLGRVLRAERGQLYELSDGSRVWLARIEEVKRDHIAFSLVEELPADRLAFQTMLLLSVVKFEAFEWALEKATELGISEIVPLAAARSEKALLAAARKRAERWKKILLEASQQSRRVRLPTLAPLTKTEQAFASYEPSKGLCILLSERPDAPSLRSLLEGRRPRGANVATPEKANLAIGDPQGRRTAGQTVSAILAIGPEGGWTGTELEAARNNRFQEASLGPLILRTETAVVAALASLNYALGE